jgi:hypothetical protein
MEGGAMKFAEYLSHAWSHHGDQPESVAADLEKGLALCTSPDELIALINLTTHLYTEHLHRFVEGERKLRELGKSEVAISSQAEFAIARSVMALRLCEGTVDPETDRLGLTPGDLARSLAVAASALAIRKSDSSERYLRLAIATTSNLELTAHDGVARALAIAGNNTAANLETLKPRDAQQTELMLLAAETARKFWEIAGTWLEVERAEYRFAKSCLAAGRLEDAVTHARLCLKVCEQNEAAPLEFFFAYECLASVEKAASPDAFQSTLKRANEWFEKLTPDDQSWARDSLSALTPH